MAAITVTNEETRRRYIFENVAEVGSVADFITFVQEGWGEGVLLKPNGARLTPLSPGPVLQGDYIFQPKSGIVLCAALSRTVHVSWFPISYGCCS